MEDLSVKIIEEINKINELYNNIHEIEKVIDEHKKHIKKYTHELVDQLGTINGWESLVNNRWAFSFNKMFKECKNDDERLTLIKDCYLEWTDDNIMMFKVPFTASYDKEADSALEINLEKTLEEQVNEALNG